jgi:hypothetical protein
MQILGYEPQLCASLWVQPNEPIAGHAQYRKRSESHGIKL